MRSHKEPSAFAVKQQQRKSQSPKNSPQILTSTAKKNKLNLQSGKKSKSLSVVKKKIQRTPKKNLSASLTSAAQDSFEILNLTHTPKKSSGNGKSKNKSGDGSGKGKTQLKLNGSSEQSKTFLDEVTNDSPKPSDSSILDKTVAHSPNFNSRGLARDCFDWLIYPVTRKVFLSDVFEKKPVLVRRHSSNYYNNLFSTSEFERILNENILYYGKNIDVTSYNDGVRKTLNPPGRVHNHVVWDHFKSGCSIRLLNPQTFSRSVWKLNSILQEFFGSFVGANIYLTPSGSQGFAPHYDDIEAFVLQLEGKKTWNLYSPRSPSEMLPKFSSGNFQQDEIGKPILTAELEPGDLLYFPRGTIHQAKSTSEVHSLHITLSTCQKNSWEDLLQIVIPRALQIAFEEDEEFRKSLPSNYMDIMGVAHSDRPSKEQTKFIDHMKQLWTKMFEYAPIHSAVDQRAKDFIHDCLPPVLNQEETANSVYGKSECWHNEQLKLKPRPLNYQTEVRLIRPNLLRLVMEDENVHVYHAMCNSRQFREEDAQCFELPPEMAPAVECMQHTYPQYLKIQDLPLEENSDKVKVSEILFRHGLLMTKPK